MMVVKQTDIQFEFGKVGGQWVKMEIKWEKNTYKRVPDNKYRG